jgi:transcriptional regulator with XRE-family HTH domain
MTLAEYVTKVMTEQGLNPSEVERRSGKKITDAHVRNIMNGTTTNPRLNVLLALAEGLGVSPVDLFKAAAGIEEDLSAYQLVVVMQNLLKHPDKLKGVKKVLKIE